MWDFFPQKLPSWVVHLMDGPPHLCVLATPPHATVIYRGARQPCVLKDLVSSQDRGWVSIHQALPPWSRVWAESVMAWHVGHLPSWKVAPLGPLYPEMRWAPRTSVVICFLNFQLASLPVQASSGDVKACVGDRRPLHESRICGWLWRTEGLVGSWGSAPSWGVVFECLGAGQMVVTSRPGDRSEPSPEDCQHVHP